MRAIAEEAGVATGNAYYYYGSKEELRSLSRQLLSVAGETLH